MTEKLGLFFFAALITIVLLVAPGFLPAAYAASISPVLPYAFLVDLVLLAIGALAGWLEYTHYSIILSDEDITITRGLLSEEEQGIPYRRIKEATIERSITDELFGLSDLVIVIQGEEESVSKEAGRVILPLLPKESALVIQNKLLGKAEVEEELQVGKQ